MYESRFKTKFNDNYVIVILIFSLSLPIKGYGLIILVSTTHTVGSGVSYNVLIILFKKPRRTLYSCRRVRSLVADKYQCKINWQRRVCEGGGEGAKGRENTEGL